MTHKTLAFTFGVLGFLGSAAALQTAPTFDLDEVHEAELDLAVVAKEPAFGHAAHGGHVRHRSVWLEAPVPGGTGGGAARIWLTTATSTAPNATVTRFGSPYTAHESNPARTDIIVLLLDDRFRADERARILEAAHEWNYVLNGYLRFEIGVTSPDDSAVIQPAAWAVARVTGGANAQPGFRDAVLAQAQRLPSSSGLLLVFVDRLRRDSLRQVMLHELGHVLGLEHDDRSRLMAARYFRDRQKCVDRITVEQLATARGLPVAELNWCRALEG